MTNNLPRQFVLGVNAKGFDLVKYFFRNDKLPIRVDLSKTNLRVTAKQEKEFDIATTNFLPEIKKYIGEDMDVNTIKPDTIKLYFSDMLSKKVPVKLNVMVHTRKQYEIKGIAKISPDSITISGTKEELDTTNFVMTAHEEYREADRTIAEMINIEKNLEGITFYSLDKVFVTIPIEKFTEKTITLPIKLVNLSPKYNVKLLPSKVTVNFMVAISDYNRATPGLFNAVVDFKDFNPDNAVKLKVSLSTSPDYVKTIQISPPFVDYIIIK